MGITDLVKGPKVYLDTNIWIYAFEGFPEHIDSITEIFRQIDKNNLGVVTSELTLAEILVKPFKEKNIAFQKNYIETFNNTSKIEIIPISRNVLIEAARLSGIYRIKLPDAIHAATSILSACQSFITNDTSFKKIDMLNIICLADL